MIVGLTGGIGSGKSFVASIFEELGSPIYISDVKAKEIMHSDTDVINSIVDLFGENAYQDKVLNRKWIADKVFSNKELLQKLNHIVHPAVAKDFALWYNKQEAPFVIKESAILFESNGYKKCDKVILVTAPKSIRVERVINRDKISEKAIIARMDNQWSDEQRIPLSDYIIENLDKENTITQSRKLFQILRDSN